MRDEDGVGNPPHLFRALGCEAGLIAGRHSKGLCVVLCVPSLSQHRQRGADEELAWAVSRDVTDQHAGRQNNGSSEHEQQQRGQKRVRCYSLLRNERCGCRTHTLMGFHVGGHNV